MVKADMEVFRGWETAPAWWEGRYIHRIRRTSGLTILALSLFWSNLADARPTSPPEWCRGPWWISNETTGRDRRRGQRNTVLDLRRVLADIVGRYALNHLPRDVGHAGPPVPVYQTEVKSGIFVTLGFAGQSQLPDATGGLQGRAEW